MVESGLVLIEKAQKIANQFDSNLLYTRVDGIIIENKLYLMEIECIEPDLYFNLKKGSLQQFVESIIELIS